MTGCLCAATKSTSFFCQLVYTATTEKFNGKAWVDDMNLPMALGSHCQVTLSNRKVLLMAGETNVGLSEATLLLDTVLQKWEPKANVYFKR